MDDWGNWRLNSNMNRMTWIFLLLANVATAQQSPLRALTNIDLGSETNKSSVAVPMDISHKSVLPKSLKDTVDKKFEDVVKSAQAAAVLVLVY
jgi:hypothetical protein